MKGKQENQYGDNSAKSEKQFPYKAVLNGVECEVIAEHGLFCWVISDNGIRGVICMTTDLKPLPEKPLEFGEWIENNTVSLIGDDDTIHINDATRIYNEYQDYLKTFEG